MGLNVVQNRLNLSSNTDRRPSPAIWSDCPWDMLNSPRTGDDGPHGVRFQDDFTNFPLIGTQTTQIGHGQYKVFNTGAGVVQQVSTFNSVEFPGGILSIGVDTDNDSGSCWQSYPSYMMSGLTSNTGKLWFEARCAFTPVTTNGIGWFVGFSEVELYTLATGVPFNGGDAITNSGSFIGFRKPEDDTTTADTVYSDRATSFTAIGDADLTGLAANTWFKIGLVYDPERSTDCVRFFLNNQQLTNVLSKSTLTGLTNLDANGLGLACSVIADSAGTSGFFYMDWWQVAQVLPTISS